VEPDFVGEKGGCEYHFLWFELPGWRPLSMASEQLENSFSEGEVLRKRLRI
jgi:hypothetical protein